MGRAADSQGSVWIHSSRLGSPCGFRDLAALGECLDSMLSEGFPDGSVLIFHDLGMQGFSSSIHPHGSGGSVRSRQGMWRS